MISSTRLALVVVAVGALMTPILPAVGQAESPARTRYVKTKTPNPLSSNDLLDVSCWSKAGCMAVGGPGFRGKRAIALEHSRRGWKVSRLPGSATGSQFATLHGVSCPSADYCVAVGYRDGRSLIAAWDGSQWQRQRTRHPGAYDYFESVSCTSDDSCLAVGAHGSERRERPLVRHWNGRRWTSVNVESHGRRSRGLGVDCFRTDKCMIVGGKGAQGSTQSRAPVWIWRGERARLMVSPDGGNELVNVDCLNARRCYGVGSGLVRYNGRAWRDVDFPRSRRSFLLDVECSSHSVCDAVGYGDNELAAVHFNGSAWRLARLPDLNHGFWLHGLDCAADRCYAVGSRGDNRLKTLALRS